MDFRRFQLYGLHVKRPTMSDTQKQQSLQIFAWYGRAKGIIQSIKWTPFLLYDTFYEGSAYTKLRKLPTEEIEEPKETRVQDMEME